MWLADAAEVLRDAERTIYRKTSAEALSLNCLVLSSQLVVGWCSGSDESFAGCSGEFDSRSRPVPLHDDCIGFSKNRRPLVLTNLLSSIQIAAFDCIHETNDFQIAPYNRSWFQISLPSRIIITTTDTDLRQVPGFRFYFTLKLTKHGENRLPLYPRCSWSKGTGKAQAPRNAIDHGGPGIAFTSQSQQSQCTGQERAQSPRKSFRA